MKVLMITGSAHKTGTTSVLADSFERGALEAGHEVTRFDAAFKQVHPCIACEKCHEGNTGCAFKDDMEELNPVLLAAEVIVFVTPIYYYDMTAQLKLVIDRFYANDAALHKNKKAILMTAMADDRADSAYGANVTFEKMTRFLEWDVAGIINATACWNADDIKRTDYPNDAYELGKHL